eukprot:Rmarinus@m.11747
MLPRCLPRRCFRMNAFIPVSPFSTIPTCARTLAIRPIKPCHLGRVTPFLTIRSVSYTRPLFFSDVGSHDSPDTSEEDTQAADDPPANAIILDRNNGLPRPPHVVAVPLVKRPLIPGVWTTLVFGKDVAQTLMDKVGEGGRHEFIGVFLANLPHTSQLDDDEHDDDHVGVEDEFDAALHPPPSPEMKAKIDALDRGLLTSFDDIHPVGCFARIQGINTAEDGVQLIVVGHHRIRATNLVTEGPPLVVQVEHLDEPTVDPNARLIRALCNELRMALRELIESSAIAKQHLSQLSVNFDATEPGRLADLCAQATSSDPAALQEIMQTQNIAKRLNLAIVMVRREIEVAKVQKTIMEDVESQMSQRNRKYYLQQQLRQIQKELGQDGDDRGPIISALKQRIQENPPTGEAAKMIEQQLSRLQVLDPSSAEFNVTRTHLDWLTSLPYSQCSEENYDIATAQEVLNNHHYGLEDVKKRILEFIAVSKLRGQAHGRILCLAGPPGVGKTTICQSIAEAMNRKFQRFSVGGLGDYAEIKGHRRTYVGAMPGKVIQCLKQSGTSNPLILIDEIDKVRQGASFQGDVSSALLEVLDPSQNGTFQDLYLDVPVDLSKVLFMCTANSIATIPEPLLDRMEVIPLSGYMKSEKLKIAANHIIPPALLDAGVTSEQVIFTTEALSAIVDGYCREAGVRNLQKEIEKVIRKVAFRLVQGDIKSETVTQENLGTYLGLPRFAGERLYESGTPTGVVMGLAWTASGGRPLFIETADTSAVSRVQFDAIAENETGGDEVKGEESGGADVTHRPSARGESIVTTGRMGDVMRESTTIAYTVAKAKLRVCQPNNDFFASTPVHLHVPSGAVPKDGPSAGIAMVTALLSLAMNKPVRGKLAMTGEISLHGKVLAVGGIKEKMLAAKEENVNDVILPEGNRKDFEELDDDIKEGINVHYVSDYEEVFLCRFSKPFLDIELSR